MRDFTAKHVAVLPPSGIRKFFDIVATMDNVISLGVGEPDFKTPERVRKAAMDSLAEGKTRYSSNWGMPKLREEIAHYLKRRFDLDYDTDQILCTIGASEAIDVTLRTILEPGDEVLVVEPSYVAYKPAIQLQHGVPVVVTTKAENDFKLMPEELEAAITPKTKALILPYPNNPTGAIMEREDLERIAPVCIKHDLLVISDEIYEKLIYDEGKKHISIASLGKEIYDRTIVINGVSKSYAMTGWRIGFAAAPLEVAKLMASLQSHMASNPNSIAQEATLAALEGPQDCVAEMCKEFKKRRDYIYEREEAIPMISALKPEGAFYLFVDVSGTYGKSYEGTEIHSAADFAAILIAEKYVAVVPCADFGMPDYIRLSYATDMEQIKKGMDRIEEMVKALA